MSLKHPHYRAALGAAVMAAIPVAATAQSVARLWNDQNLNAIRIDFPDPGVHARNLFTTSVAMWDAWAAYDSTAVGYVHREAATPPTGMTIEDARREAISYAAHRVLVHRYKDGVNGLTSLLEFDMQMVGLGYPPSNDIVAGDSPAAVGNRVAASVIAFFTNDGSNEAGGYEDPTYMPMNDPMILALPFQLMDEPNRWQPLAFEFSFTQNGLEAEQIQTFLGAQWGEVRPFAIESANGQLVNGRVVYHDPGLPPQLGGAEDAAFKANSVDVVRYSRLLDPDGIDPEGDGGSGPIFFDCSPGAIGNSTLGTNDGTGHTTNPLTMAPYIANTVNQADFGRVVAEYWADGPDSETPPGHWNSIANDVVDAPGFQRQIGGTGPVLDPLEWDVKMYLALNGAVHDAAVAAWGCKRAYDYVRPISSIRQMCARGQSSNPGDVATYHPEGIPLEPGLVEVITTESTMTGAKHAHLAPHVGKIALYCWGGEPTDPETEYTGNAWILGTRWLPYQRDTFVTPAFAGYISGHSTFSRAAAEVLTAMTGSPYFPGGLGSHTAPAGSLEFELGPSEEVVLQWATYYDAADQAGLSRLYGGIHVAPDDGPGRIVGAQCGLAAWDVARMYFDGSALAGEVPIRVDQGSGGDLIVTWLQNRGMFYKLQFGTVPGSWSDFTSYSLAEDDLGQQVIPAASVGGQQFYRALRSSGP